MVGDFFFHSSFGFLQILETPFVRLLTAPVWFVVCSRCDMARTLKELPGFPSACNGHSMLSGRVAAFRVRGHIVL